MGTYFIARISSEIIVSKQLILNVFPMFPRK
jgi:hypothetical protein